MLYNVIILYTTLLENLKRHCYVPVSTVFLLVLLLSRCITNYNHFIIHFSDDGNSAADPGAVKTNIMREIPSVISGIAFMGLKLLGILQSPENGIHSILDAALAPPVSISSYMQNMVEFANQNMLSLSLLHLMTHRKHH